MKTITPLKPQGVGVDYLTPIRGVLCLVKKFNLDFFTQQNHVRVIMILDSEASGQMAHQRS